MHELRDLGRGRGQAFSWCHIRKIEAKNVRQIRAFGATEGKPLIEPSVPAAASRAAPPLGTTRCGIGSSPWRRRAQSANWRRRRAQATNGRRRAVGVVVSDSEEELEVLRQPNLIQKLADVVTQRASCVLELEGGAQLTLRPAPQRRRPPPPTKHLLYYPVPGWLTLTPPAPLSPDHARDSTITVAVLVLNVAARL